eukprot:g4846.t1
MSLKLTLHYNMSSATVPFYFSMQKRYRYPELWNADLRLALLRYRHPELCNTALRLALLRYRYPELWNADLRLALLRYSSAGRHERARPFAKPEENISSEAYGAMSGRCKGSPTSTTHASVAQGSSIGSGQDYVADALDVGFRTQRTRTRLDIVGAVPVACETVKPACNSARKARKQINIGVDMS